MDGHAFELDGESAGQHVQAELDGGRRFLSFTSSLGRILMVVTNGRRAKVVLLDGVGDPGQHAVDPTATGVSGGYLSGDTQVDEYSDSDTIEIEQAMSVIRDLVTGSAGTSVTWRDDR